MEREASPELVDAMLGKAYVALKDPKTAERYLRRAFEHGNTELNLEPLAETYPAETTSRRLS